ncbi:general transcription factor 3C polypeptide 1 [Pholidichthys leucotaenia]
MDPWSAVEDEVALEGLDGITIPSLWVRLESRRPRFPLKLDDCTKELIWKSVATNAALKFYALPEERDDVELTDRFDSIDKDTGTEITDSFSSTKKDIYPIHVVPEHKDGIQGSCAYFKERINITKQIRSTSLTVLVSLADAFERYGRKLVIVASQSLRHRCLIGSEGDPDAKLFDDSYCVLEKIGRARWQGELQGDLHGGTFKGDARKFHYLRKSLIKHSLITMQPYIRRLKTGQMQHSVLLLLKRFHTSRRTRNDMMMESVSNFLQQFPGQFATVAMLKKYLNLSESPFQRFIKYMRASRLVEYIQVPLDELDPSRGPCTNKNGKKVNVRCAKLIKPNARKGVTDDVNDDDEDEEDDTSEKRETFTKDIWLMERDLLSQAYHCVLASETTGITQRNICLRLNLTKLEARMVCRRLEKEGLIKGFMVAEGRQRTSKFISHKYVNASSQLQLFVKEQERQMQFLSSAPQTSDTDVTSPKTPSTVKTPPKENGKTSAARKSMKNEDERNTTAPDKSQMCDFGMLGTENEVLEDNGAKAKRMEGLRAKTAGLETEQTQPDVPIIQQKSNECETPDGQATTPTTSSSVSVPTPDQAPSEEEKPPTAGPASPLPQSEVAKPALVNNIIIESLPETSSRRNAVGYETYRLLRRKNLIVEAVQKLKVIECVFYLQKMINDMEKEDGISTKCCKKTILRLIHSLAREGLLKVYSTTVIQHGITKELKMIVHPSIEPGDERINQLIEQTRFKISSSYSTVRQQVTEAKAKEKESKSVTSKLGSSMTAKMRAKDDSDEDFKPTKVQGLSKVFGFQPKMHRLRVIHNFLWYLIYGHPLRQQSTSSAPDSKTPASHNGSDSSDKQPDGNGQEDIKKTESCTSTGPSVDQQTLDASVSNMSVGSGDEEEEQSNGDSESKLKVYADEDSWRRFVPPVRVNKKYPSGWAMVGNLLLCLPLSIFIQVVQISYEVDGLEEYLNDPVKQHYLVRALPAKMRRRLLYRRKYIFVFHESLMKLVYMGLLQFGPTEKFMDKDQVFVYVKRKATIVDTTHTEPHYWLVTEYPDRPFERRKYTFNTAEDVENFWFDLMCVCLNTPLGVYRGKRKTSDPDSTLLFVPDRHVFVGLAYLLKGSIEVSDDGSTPGDGRGAGGLDSEFFAHLKRNWLWTTHQLVVKHKPSGSMAPETQKRLKSIVSQDALRLTFNSGESSSCTYMTTKHQATPEKVEMGIEPASRNKKVVGGKGQKRKRIKKDLIKVPCKKKKESTKQTPAHDEVDHQAMKRMTKQRVFWSIQEDSLIMLCHVASHLLNSKLEKKFHPHCIVRDLLHAEIERSVDKTSVAVGRRSRYILRNPQTLLNYRICLAEVYQDRTLMRLLEEKKPADAKKPEECSQAYCEYVRLLRQKFSSVMSTCDVIIPDTKTQLFSQFKVSAIDELKPVLYKDTINSASDIHSVVLHNLIQSTLAMTSSQMKLSRSFQTFHLYSKYDQELLWKVFLETRKNGLVNHRRLSHAVEPKKYRSLPILPMSYQLSQSYFRYFSWRFPHQLCTDSFRFLRSLIDNGMRDGRPTTAFYHETESRLKAGDEVEKKNVSKKKEKTNGRKSDGAPANGEVEPETPTSDAIKEGDESKTGGQESLKEVCMSDEKSEVKRKPGQQETEESPLSEEQSQIEQPPGESATSAPSESPPDVSDMMQLSLHSPGGACVTSLSLMSLGLLSMFVSIPKWMVVVDSSLVDNNVTKSIAELDEDEDNDEDGEECEGKKNLQVKAHQASHTNYLMMRGYCSPGIAKLRNLNTHDNIVMESCIIKLQLRSTPSHYMFEQNSPPLDLTKCGPSLLPSILTHLVCSPSCPPPSVEECERYFIEQREFTPQDIEACAQLRRSLGEAGEKGLDLYELHRKHAHLQEQQSGHTRSLQQYMEELEEAAQVVKVGSMAIRWVLMEHAEPWLLTMSPKQWGQSCVPSDQMKFLENQHSIPFMHHKRSRENRKMTGMPPAKKMAMDSGTCPIPEDVDAVPGDITETHDEKEQLEQQEEKAEEEGGDKLQNMEGGGQQTQSMKEGEDEARDWRMETRQKTRQRKTDELCSPPTGSRADDEISFISRPWRLVDGKLNRLVCKGMMEAVLYHIMSRPGLTQQALLEHYKDLVQPVVVLDLVQSLIELGCVTKKTLVKSPKRSLFGRSAPLTRTETKVTTEEPDTVFYEPTISCTLRLCQVLPNERFWNSLYNDQP